jgi:hypothetical protein
MTRDGAARIGFLIVLYDCAEGGQNKILRELI